MVNKSLSTHLHAMCCKLLLLEFHFQISHIYDLANEGNSKRFAFEAVLSNSDYSIVESNKSLLLFCNDYNGSIVLYYNEMWINHYFPQLTLLILRASFVWMFSFCFIPIFENKIIVIRIKVEFKFSKIKWVSIFHVPHLQLFKHNLHLCIVVFFL
jgi:hypothetical protein